MFILFVCLFSLQIFYICGALPVTFLKSFDLKVCFIFVLFLYIELLYLSNIFVIMTASISFVINWITTFIQQNYTILSEADIRQWQENDILKISTVLSISKIEASILLRHYSW